MVRRATKAKPRQTAAYRAAAEKSIAAQMKKDIDKDLARGVQKFALLTMNGLAQEGPAWSGEFSASWGFVPSGMTPSTPGTAGRIYKYTGNDVPVRDVERYLRDGIVKFNIVNTVPHAAIAIDEEKGIFEHDGKTPVKPEELGTGRDQPSLRYEIGNTFSGDRKDASASRTADEDWFPTYVLGGQLQQNLTKGLSLFGKSSSGTGVSFGPESA